MSAPLIPSLNSLRHGTGRGRGRGRGGLSSKSEGSSHGPSLAKDEIVQRTDLDASTSRLSAVEAGYLEDPFAKLLTPGGETSRRLPLMNRGTYVRTSGIDRLVDQFCLSQPHRRKQIISLGAGSDTRFFRLKRSSPVIDLVYHELDFPTNATAKIRALQSCPARNTIARLSKWDVESASISTSSDGTSSLHAPDYHIHPIDLRSLPGASMHEVSAPKPLTDVDPDLPTLLISECCLIYLSPSDANAVLSYFTSLIPPTGSLGIVIYEPIRPNDPFGRTMVLNLTARGIHLQTLNTHATLTLQRKRLEEHGFESKGGDGGTGAADVDFVWREWVDEKEKERVEGLEWMDEVEEWRLLMQHYCVVWGWRVPDTADSAFETWKNLSSQDE